MRRQLKYALSFLKRRWTFSDYPVRIRYTKPEPPEFAGSRLTPIPWVAQIEGWLLSGHGDTRGQALADLARKFDEYKNRNGNLPRPGAKVPVAFASTERISRLQPLSTEFLRRIFELEPEDCLVTDESTLWDLAFGSSLEPVLARIQHEFGIDASVIEGAKLVDILEHVAAEVAGEQAASGLLPQADSHIRR